MYMEGSGDAKRVCRSIEGGRTGGDGCNRLVQLELVENSLGWMGPVNITITT